MNNHTSAKPSAASGAASDSVLTGTGVVPGVAYGPIRWVSRQVPEVDTSTGPPPDQSALAAETERFTAAAATVSERLEARASAATGVAAEVLKANSGLARDRGWAKEVRRHLASGVSAAGATRLATDKFVAMFAKLGDRQAERITDLEDVCTRVIAELSGLPEPGIPDVDSPTVLCADDLAPADTAGLDPQLVRAIVTEFGGPTSHTSIIARQLGIPCVVAVAGLSSLAEHTPVLVDGALGLVDHTADPVTAEAAATRDRELRARAATWSGPAVLADGTPVELLANVQDGASAAAAAAGPAQGIGLFRTELAFLDRTTEPSVDEQTQLYAEVLRAFPERKIVIRTLDAGSDKPVPFVGLPSEDNPALGVRGIRFDRLDRGMLDRQLDAIAAAATESLPDGRHPQVMAPMIATVSEARDFAERCRTRGISPGIMVEVPAVAVCIDQFLPFIDFLSIGTNDLTQYTMAADRMSSSLAELTDPWQPAVLRLIRQVTTATAHRGDNNDTVAVGVCGEAAADPHLACVLIGLGVDSLSAASAAIPFVGTALAEVTLAQCQQAAEIALRAESATQSRRQVIEFLS